MLLFIQVLIYCTYTNNILQTSCLHEIKKKNQSTEINFLTFSCNPHVVVKQKFVTIIIYIHMISYTHEKNVHSFHRAYSGIVFRSFSLSGTSCESPWYIQLTWCLYNLNNVVSLTITLSYYGLLTVGKTPPLPPQTSFPPRTSIAFDLFLPVV